jgi:hypothetical protein
MNKIEINFYNKQYYYKKEMRFINKVKFTEYFTKLFIRNMHEYLKKRREDHEIFKKVIYVNTNNKLKY